MTTTATQATQSTFFFLMAIGISQYVKEACSQRYPYFRESEGYRTYGQRGSRESPTVPSFTGEEMEAQRGYIWLGQGYSRMWGVTRTSVQIFWALYCAFLLSLPHRIFSVIKDLLTFTEVNRVLQSHANSVETIWVGSHESIKWKWDISLQFRNEWIPSQVSLVWR